MIAYIAGEHKTINQIITVRSSKGTYHPRKRSTEARKDIMKPIMKCLVADDSAHIRELFVMALEEFGHSVIAVNGKRDALDALAKNQFDFVLTDNDMPTQNDGMEVVEQARKLLPNAVIWLSSGRADSEMEARSIGLGADKCFFKPYVYDHLRHFAKEGLVVA